MFPKIPIAPFISIICLLLIFQFSLCAHPNCPEEHKYGPGPSTNCAGPSDPNNRPPSKLESWFSREMFDDLFPYANLGWGPNRCSPYSYEAFVIAARYLPRFGAESPDKNGLGWVENTRRDVATFLAHAIQETGLNDISLYHRSDMNESRANDCFYRGGLFNWFEGGPISAFLDPSSPGYKPEDGEKCAPSGRYCSPSLFHQCVNGTDGSSYFKSCYFGRGAIQISYNYNYGQFGDWLNSQNISVDLLAHPNLVLTKMDPPLALMASLWFYMTPQPPKPAMHDIILGQWHPGAENDAAGYSGPIFGPTSLVINNECTGEDPIPPGSGGENRRIRAFKWFCRYFGVTFGTNETMLSCKKMPRRFDQYAQNVSWEPDWSSTWRDDQPCQCAPAAYGGPVPYFQKDFYPAHFVQQNDENGKKCQKMLYGFPSTFGLDLTSSGCLNFTANGIKMSNNVEKQQQNGTKINEQMGELLLVPSTEKENKIVEEMGNQLVKRVAASMLGRGSTNYLHPDITALLGG